MATPAAMRSGRWRALRKLAATPDPARATASSGIDRPTAKEIARPTMCQVNWPVFEATITEARTGPAQGTNAAPSTRPRPKPALSPVVRGARRANGRSRTSITFGTIMPMPTATSSTMPAQRIAVCVHARRDAEEPGIDAVARILRGRGRGGLCGIASPGGAEEEDGEDGKNARRNARDKTAKKTKQKEHRFTLLVKGGNARDVAPEGVKTLGLGWC